MISTRVPAFVGWTATIALVLGTTACGSRVDRPAFGAPVQQAPAVEQPRTAPPRSLSATAPTAAATPARQAAPPTVEPRAAAPLARSRPEPTASRPAPRAARPAAPRAAPVRPAPARPAPAAAPAAAPAPTGDRAPARIAAPADRYAFLVGVQHYRSPTRDTLASVADVVLVRQSLLAAGWLPQNIRVVVDDQATGDAIRQGMDWLQARAVAGRTFSFFHYSGHVKQFGGQSEALWPIDRDWVRDTEVAAQLAQVQGRLWVDIAGCEAGSFLPGLRHGRILFTGSSTATQKSYEHPEWRTSVWTGLLFRIAPARADANGDGRVVMGEALRYSRRFAEVVTAAQRPHGPQTPVVNGDRTLAWTLDGPPA